MKLALIAALAGSALGLTIGFFVGRGRAVRSDSGESFQRKPLPSDAAHDASGGNAGAGHEELEARLARAEAELRSLRAAARPAPTRLELLRGQVDELVAEKDDRGLIRLMAKFAALGEPGYADALAIWKKLIDDELGLNVSWREFEDALRGTMPELSLWVLRNPSLVPWETRDQAARSLPSEIAGPTEILGLLEAEKDDRIAASLVCALVPDDSMIPALEAALRAHSGNADSVRVIVGAIQDVGTDTSKATLRALASDSNPTVRDEAEYCLLSGDPPAAGVLINQVGNSDPLARSGLRRGDILVSVDGVDITSRDAWENQVRLLYNSDAPVALIINRAGAALSFRLAGRDVAVISGIVVAPSPK